MKYDIRDYVKMYPGWLDEQECLKTVEQMDSLNWQRHEFYNAATKTYSAQSGEQELDWAFGDHLSTLPYLMQRAWDAYARYIVELEFPWFAGWQGYSQMRFNRYQQDQVMAKHCDHIHTMFDGTRRGVPTLTFLTQLNADYEGGELVLFDDLLVPKQTGTVLVFPSCFLFPHQVLAVTKGIRYSSVCWAY